MYVRQCLEQQKTVGRVRSTVSMAFHHHQRTATAQSLLCVVPYKTSCKRTRVSPRQTKQQRNERTCARTHVRRTTNDNRPAQAHRRTNPPGFLVRRGVPQRDALGHVRAFVDRLCVCVRGVSALGVECFIVPDVCVCVCLSVCVRAWCVPAFVERLRS